MENKILNLNEEQYAAAVHTEGPLLVIAGPGSGKTRTLVERTVHMLMEKDIAPEKILMSTFTDRAAKELIGRVSERIKNYEKKININDIYMGTIHSICLKLIDEHIKFSDFEEGYQVLDDTEQHFFLYTKLRAFKDLEGYNEFFKEIGQSATNWGRAGKLRNWLNKINEEGRTLDYVKGTEDKKIVFLREALKVYHKLLIEDNVLDFASIQRELYRMLLNNEELLKEIQEKIEYIMIDEYQDTNTIQEKIIFLLGGEKKNICVVGDDDQGIYRFRGASIKNILEFPQKFQECKIITLDINYRSHPDIITFCNRWINLINWKGFRYEKDIQPPYGTEYPNNPGVIRIGGNSENQWKENIYRFIKQLKTTGKIQDYSQVAFLFKSVRFSRVKELIDYIEERGIPAYSPRSKNFFYRKEVKLVLGTLLVLFPQVKPLVLEDVYIRKTTGYYKDCINALKHQLSKDKPLYEWILKKREEYVKFEGNKRDNISRIFYSLFSFTTFKELIDLTKEGPKEARASYNLGILSQIFDKFENISRLEYITEENIEKIIRYFFATHMKLLFEQGIDEYEDKETAPLGAVSFMTIHQAKGLEFPVVIVGSLESDPEIKEMSEEDRLEEIITLGNEFEPADRKPIFDFWRVFYTAFSRAQNLLVLTSIESRTGGKELPSKTFRPMYETIPHWTDESFKFERLNISKYKGAEIKEKLSYTGHILVYEDCPLRYRFYKEFAFRPLKTSKTSYGILVHKSIEDIHKEAGEDLEKKFTDEELIEIVEKNYDTLKKNFRIFLGENMRERAFKDIKKYVHNTNNNWKNIIAYEEKEYSIENDYILEGTIDLLRKNDSYTELLDFKTGKFHSFDDPRFLSYKRQLEIYSYMLKDQYPLEQLKAYLYYTGNPTEPMVEIELNRENIEKTFDKFNDTVKKILNREFQRREFSEERCRECEFINYCREEQN